MRVHIVAPAGFDDLDQPSGGNVYDRRICAGLLGAGWDVRISTVAAAPLAGAPATELARVVAAIPDGETVLLDGLIASPAAAELLPHALRLRLIVLLHMPLATALDRDVSARALLSEQAVLRSATAVVVTSAWTCEDVAARYAVPASRLFLARPGVDHIPDGPLGHRRAARRGTSAGGRLLCVGVLGWHKGQDILVEALATLTEDDWQCTLVGALDRHVDFVDQLRARLAELGLGRSVRLAGVLTGRELDKAYASADLLVTASRAETYGMTVSEALARGLPVLATDVGGLPEALGFAPDAARPGWLIPPGDPAALATALREWLRNADHRERLRAAASQRRRNLPHWDDTTGEIVAALTAGAPVLD